MKNRLNVFALALVILFAAPVFAADKVIISYSSHSYAFGSPISAVAVTDTRLKTHREETKRVLRAMLRGLRAMHERRDDTITIMSK